MKRVALLGATGSIGRQAIEVIERNPELELCALASGSTDLGALAAEHGVSHTQVGGDLDRAARSLGAGRRPERRRRLRRSRRDPVGARARRHARAGEQGEPRRRRRARARGEGAGRRPAAAGRLRALGALPVPRRPGRGLRRLARPDRLGRTVPRPHAGRPRRRRRRRRARAPDLEHGAEDHRRLRDAGEQGSRADRGALPLRPPVRAIEVVVHPSSIVHSLVRFRDGAALAHLGYPDMTVPISFALTYPERAATDVPQLDLAGGLTLEFSAPDWRRSRCSRWRGGPGSPEAPTRASSMPRTRSPSRPSSTAGCRSSGSPRSSRRRSPRRTAAPARDLAELVEADAAARRLAERGVPVA